MRCVVRLSTAVFLFMGFMGMWVWAFEGRHWSRDEITVEIGKRSDPGPVAPTEPDPLRGVSQENLGLRDSPLPKGGLPGTHKGSGKETPANLLLGRKEIEENGLLLAALFRLGSNPSPMGISRVLDIMERYPVEFWGLADKAIEASKGEDEAALERLWEAVWVFREAEVISEEDWDDLGYVLARINQGAPVFTRPLEATKGASRPQSGAPGGRHKGDDTSDWFGGRGNFQSPIGEIGLLKDPKGFGFEQDLGDGLMGWSDEEKGPPKGSRWVPKVDVGVKPDFHGPKTTGPDAGFYGGVNIGMLPNHVGRGKKEGGGKGEQKESTQRAEGMKFLKAAEGALKMEKTSNTPTEKEMWSRVRVAYELSALAGEMVKWYSAEKVGPFWMITVNNTTYIYDSKSRNCEKAWWLTAPEGNDGETGNPLEDPQLLLRMTRAADRQQNKPDVVPGVVDPMPIMGDATASRAGGGELASAGAAKAEAAWKFAGKKPGSEVTDPAEWHTFGGEEGSGIAKDLSLITDPAEPQAGLVAAGKEASAISERNRAFFARALSQLLIMSIQAGSK